MFHYDTLHCILCIGCGKVHSSLGSWACAIKTGAFPGGGDQSLREKKTLKRRREREERRREREEKKRREEEKKTTLTVTLDTTEHRGRALV